MKNNNLVSNVFSVLMLLTLLIIVGCTATEKQQQEPTELKTWKVPNIGEAAEAYFSPDGKAIICTAKREGDPEFVVYTINIDGTDVKKINDKGEDA